MKASEEDRIVVLEWVVVKLVSLSWSDGRGAFLPYVLVMERRLLLERGCDQGLVTNSLGIFYLLDGIHDECFRIRWYSLELVGEEKQPAKQTKSTSEHACFAHGPDSPSLGPTPNPSLETQAVVKD